MISKLVIGALLCATSIAAASKPVKKTLTGCVIDKVFYSIDGRAYPIGTPADLDLAPFEGKEVSMIGWLSPGDRFELEKDGKPSVTKDACPAKSLRLVKHEAVVSLRVAAQYAAEAKDFALANKKLAEAMAMMTPPECDTFTDRAHVRALQADVKGAAKDLATIKARKACVVDGKMNPLLLQDVGEALVEKKAKKPAILAYEIALAECDGEWCSKDLKKGLAVARKLK